MCQILWHEVIEEYNSLCVNCRDLLIYEIQKLNSWDTVCKLLIFVSWNKNFRDSILGGWDRELYLSI